MARSPRKKKNRNAVRGPLQSLIITAPEPGMTWTEEEERRVVSFYQTLDRWHREMNSRAALDTPTSNP